MVALVLLRSIAVNIGICEGRRALEERVTLSKLRRDSVVRRPRVKPKRLREEAPEQPGNLPQ
jgi:hypothetical protein